MNYGEAAAKLVQKIGISCERDARELAIEALCSAHRQGAEDMRERCVKVIEYLKWHHWEGEIVRYFRHPGMSGEESCRHCGKTMHGHGWIDTQEGGHIVCPGDWIVTGIQGEKYPVKPNIFAATYEPVEEG